MSIEDGFAVLKPMPTPRPTGSGEQEIKPTEQEFTAAVEALVYRDNRPQAAMAVAKATRFRCSDGVWRDAAELAGILDNVRRNNKRDGKWLDIFGCCKVCDGEIPHGHTNDCDIYKLEQEVRTAKSSLKEAHEDQRKIIKEHDCGCEICSQTITVCPATAFSFAMEILALHNELKKAQTSLLLADTMAKYIGVNGIPQVAERVKAYRASRRYPSADTKEERGK